MPPSQSPLGPTVASNSASATLEKALARLDGSLATLLRGGAVACALSLAAAPAVSGCAVTTTGEGGDDDPGEASEALIGNGQSDWAQGQGQRNTAMVSYYQQSWYNYTNCGSRYGCSGLDVFIKLRVKPVAGANLDQKRVGVVYRTPGTSNLTTVTGSYFSTWGNGDEEWHIKLPFPMAFGQALISFNAWYQDGNGNTFYDDNSGELHPISIGTSPNAISQMGGFTNVTLDATGVHGAISARVADIDPDKQVAMVYTTDGWQTSHWLDVGAGENQWHWVEDYGADYERWQVDVNLPGSFSAFQYAIVYRHGVVNGATTYEFWDNNFGGNYSAPVQ